MAFNKHKHNNIKSDVYNPCKIRVFYKINKICFKNI